MTMFHAGLAEVVRRDPRFAYEAYEFLYEALNHTQKMLGRLPSGEVGELIAPEDISGGVNVLHVGPKCGSGGVNQRAETARARVFGSPLRPDEPVSGEFLLALPPLRVKITLG